MKLFTMLCAVFAFLWGCSTLHAPATATAQALDNATVALVVQDEGTLRPFCTGVWVSKETILTAAHCVADDMLGDKVGYATQEDEGMRTARLVKYDAEKDLALLRAAKPPTGHGTAPIASDLPAQGEELHFLGHPKGLWWTYMHGYVAAYREASFGEEIGITGGPLMQVEAPVWFGNSGGGAFNTKGELVGICSFLRRDIPEAAFYISLSTIRGFV